VALLNAPHGLQARCGERIDREEDDEREKL